MATLACALTFAALSVASLPAGAQQSIAAAPAVSCPLLSVANPNPGDTVDEGGLVISGAAFDPTASASQGSGVARVDLFLGARDAGGTFIGTAIPGTTASGNPRAWSTQVTIPNSFNRGTTFDAYAISAVSGQETHESFPLFVGTPPTTPSGAATPTPIPTTVTITTTCPPGSSGAAAAEGTPISVPQLPAPPVAPPAAVIATGGCPVLLVGNPSPGDRVATGGLVISGSAFDPTASASQGSGVARVDLFLGARDAGGTFLGSAIPGTTASGNPRAWSTQVTIPNNFNRGTTFNAYAISGVNSNQTSVEFPVFVGTPPSRAPDSATPTPVPTTVTVTTSCH
jgi:hypothetical protein